MNLKQKVEVKKVQSFKKQLYRKNEIFELKSEMNEASSPLCIRPYKRKIR